MGDRRDSLTNQTCPQCELDPFVRNHFFTGKMMGAGEFVTESHYHAEKMRHHNVRLHGWGAVCGLKVHQHLSPDCRRRYVVVDSGSALDCCGHEILVPQQETIDVSHHPEVVNKTHDGHLHALQLAVCHRECPTEDVPVLYDECGCDETQCAPNRILESFSFDILVDPPLSENFGIVTATGAFVATELHGVVGLMQANAAGNVAVVDPNKDTQAFVLDPQHRSLLTVSLPTRARALAMAADGLHFFVVTDPVVGAECEIHVYQVSDGTEVAPIAAVRAIPGSSAASVFRIATSTDNASALVVLEQASGKFYRWQSDAAHGIKDADDGVPRLLPPDSRNMELLRDGSTAFAIDGTNQIQVLNLATGNSNALVGLPASAKPNALAPFMLGACTMLAAASAIERRIYVLDLTANTLKASIDLSHPPLFLAASGTPISPWLTVFEQDAGHSFTQSIAMGPIVANDPPLVAAARLVGTEPRQIVLLSSEGQASLLHPKSLADTNCADHLWHQLEGCPSCDPPECVVLATIANYQPDMEMLDIPEKVSDDQNPATDIPKKRARIDNRRGRRLLASTTTLQKWLQCLQLKGGVPGPAGPAGPGGATGPGIDSLDAQIVDCEAAPVLRLDPSVGNNKKLFLRIPRGCDGNNGLGLNANLPKILDIGWEHGDKGLMHPRTFFDTHLNANSDEAVQARVKKGGPSVPPFTIYFNKEMFGVTRETFRINLESPGFYFRDGVQFTGLYSVLAHRFYGRITPTAGNLQTPHTHEAAPYAVTFMPHPQALQDPVALVLFLLPLISLERWNTDHQEKLDLPSLQIQLKGQFIFAGKKLEDYGEERVLDADNIGGRVGQNVIRNPPIQGGKNPSGNLTQGGTFESWFPLGSKDGSDINLAAISHLAMSSNLMMANMGAGPTPVFANYATPNSLAAVPNMTANLKNKIISERKKKPFSGVSDFRERVGLSASEFEKIKDHLIIL